MTRGNLVLCAHASGLAMKRADTTSDSFTVCVQVFINTRNNICSKAKVRLVHRTGKQCGITMRDAKKVGVCEMCARNRSHGNYFAVVGWLMYSCLYISFSFCFCLENVRCNSTVLLLHFQSKTLFAFLLLQHRLPNFVSGQKINTRVRPKYIAITDVQPAVSSERRTRSSRWWMTIAHQTTVLLKWSQLRLLTTLLHPSIFVGIIIVTS